MSWGASINTGFESGVISKKNKSWGSKRSPTRSELQETDPHRSESTKAEKTLLSVSEKGNEGVCAQGWSWGCAEQTGGKTSSGTSNERVPWGIKEIRTAPVDV